MVSPRLRAGKNDMIDNTVAFYIAGSRISRLRGAGNHRIHSTKMNLNLKTKTIALIVSAAVAITAVAGETKTYRVHFSLDGGVLRCHRSGACLRSPERDAYVLRRPSSPDVARSNRLGNETRRPAHHGNRRRLEPPSGRQIAALCAPFGGGVIDVRRGASSSGAPRAVPPWRFGHRTGQAARTADRRSRGWQIADT